MAAEAEERLHRERRDCQHRGDRDGAASAGHVQAGTAWALGGGAALYLGCLTVAQRVSARGVDPAVRNARALAGAALVVLAGIATHLTPVTLAAIAGAILVALVAVEIRSGLAETTDQ
jgi:ABC-type nitrate/sulfonate/bicarbonate transport system permease component